jgi:POT family proton-dependent oligopeptide transporter
VSNTGNGPHAPPDPLHHRQRRLRALQLLRHAQHPDALPDLHPAAVRAEAERASEAKHVFHTFVIGVYFFPLLGGWLADRFFGKYNTVFWLSLVYCAGHACLAIFEDNLKGFYFGLFLIALGSGGIKPLVASFVGDQFDQTNKDKAKVVFDAFYWIINFGSFFASLLMPVFLRDYGAAVAFGIPGMLMFIATLVFWSGRKQVRARAAGAAESAFLPQRGAHRPAGQAPGTGRPGLAMPASARLGAGRRWR